MARRQSRALALRVLYQIDVAKAEPTEALASALAGEEQDIAEFARRLVAGVLAERPEIDAGIEAAAKDWSVARMPSIDRGVLRMASYELRSEKETPSAVIIDEAVDLAKTYSTEDSGRFVNGVLAKIARTVRPEVKNDDS